MEISSISNLDLQKTQTTLESEKSSEKKVESSIGKGGDASVKRNSNLTAKTGVSSMNKDGDTLEISEKALNSSKEMPKLNVTGNSSTSKVKMSDAALAKCSQSKLKQLLQAGTISRQQYEKAMKKQNG